MTSFELHEFDRLVVKFEENPLSMQFARLADCYLNKNEVEKAVDICRRGIQYHSDYATGHFVLAKCLIRLRKYEEAEKELKQVLTLDPKFLSAHRCYGDLLKDLDGWGSAVEASYRKVLEIDPLDEDTRSRLDDLKQKQKMALEEEPEYPAIDDDEPTSMVAEKLSEEDILQVDEEEEEDELESDLEKISEPLDLEDEEIRFSSILDDIFSEKLAAEDRREEEVRKAMDKTAHEESSQTDTSAVDQVDELPEESSEGFDEAENQFPDIQDDIVSPVDRQLYFEEEKEVEQFGDLALEPEPGHWDKQPEQPKPKPKLKQNSFRKERIVTPTLGEIYAAQGQYEKAINVFEILLEKSPDNKSYKDKIQYLRQKLDEQKNSI